MSEALRPWGWDRNWEAAFRAVGGDAVPARIKAQHRDRWTIQTEDAVATARFTPADPETPPPVTGDWVGCVPGPYASDPWSIRFVLPRRSAVQRSPAGGGGPAQVVAANVDRVWVVQALDTPPNLRSIERYLAVVWDSGATPEVVLTKADLADDPEGAVAQVEGVAWGVPVRTTSTTDPDSLSALRNRLEPGSTVALLGPSGAGKSTLINHMAGSHRAETGAVRGGDGKGRHTTTTRELFRLPTGALLMDTPGMRELRVLALDTGLGAAFPDIHGLAEECRFRDCTHTEEPGCAVVQAVVDGALGRERLDSYRKLEGEAAYQRRRSDPRAMAEHVSRYKTAMKTMKHHLKRSPPDDS